MNDDRITYRQLGQLIDGRDRPAAHAIENAARGVNAAESTIRQTAAMIRAKLGEIEQRLDHGLSLNDLGELQRMPADLDRAVTLRQHHWQVLGALLTEAELASLQPARAARPLTSPRPAGQHLTSPRAPSPPIPRKDLPPMNQNLRQLIHDHMAQTAAQHAATGYPGIMSLILIPWCIS